LDSIQRAAVTKKSVVRPQERYDQIMRIANSREFDKDSNLKELNIRVHTKEMLEIKGIFPSFFILTNIYLYKFSAHTCTA
jgi:hypothetical protein